MPRKLRNFDGMWNTYPNPKQSAADAKRTIGGNVDADWITNTCVIRLSRSFNYANHRIPRRHRGLTTVSGGDGLRYAFRVRELKRYLNRVYGPPAASHVYSEVGGPVPESFVGEQGVICFEVDGWNDATGHFDLWNGEACIHSAYFHKASQVDLWAVSSETSRVRPRERVESLGGSVGEDGVNETGDVEVVQQLLTDREVDTGPIDGVCGPVTIAAIRSFQAAFLSRPDGRVDVDGRTWRELLER